MVCGCKCTKNPWFECVVGVGVCRKRACGSGEMEAAVDCL